MIRKESTAKTEWEEAQEETTSAAALEEVQVRQAMERSEASMQENQQMRQALEASLAADEAGA